MSQNGNLPRIGANNKDLWNHLVIVDTVVVVLLLACEAAIYIITLFRLSFEGQLSWSNKMANVWSCEHGFPNHAKGVNLGIAWLSVEEARTTTWLHSKLHPKTRKTWLASRLSTNTSLMFGFVFATDQHRVQGDTKGTGRKCILGECDLSGRIQHPHAISCLHSGHVFTAGERQISLLAEASHDCSEQKSINPYISI